MRRVRLFGAIGDKSGYGNAVRNFAEAFALSDIPTQFKFSKSKMRYIEGLENYSGPTNTDFYLHCPPYTRHKSSNYKIGYFYWEADKLPNSWARSLNVLNELWVPCQLVKTACINSGFKGPIKIVPTPMKRFLLSSKIGIPSYFSDEFILSDDVFKFYSIFQWHKRKGYKELLKAYLSEFTPEDNVILILKVNPLNVSNYTEDRIVKDILKVKNYLKKKIYPPIYLSKTLVSTEDVQALHNIGDCYVSPHHGEGWGMPIHDAMYAKSHVITTRFGGVTEYLANSSAHIINHELKPVTGMDWSSLYGSYQKWAYPSTKHLTYLMRDVYTNHKQYKYKTEKAHQLAKRMSVKPIAKRITKELS